MLAECIVMHVTKESNFDKALIFLQGHVNILLVKDFAGIVKQKITISYP